MSRNGQVSRAQLNVALRSRGREPISDRTYNHYRKLMRLGYTEYVPINRLDIRHANESVFDVSDRARYVDREFSSPIQVVIPTPGELVVLDGRVVRVSEGWATVRVPKTVEAISAARATKYDKGVLVFTEVGVERAVRVTEGIDRGTDIDLQLEFRSLLETDLLFTDSLFPQSAMHLALDVGPEASLYRLLTLVHTTFDLFESARGFVDLVAASADTESPVRTPTLRVRHIEFSNPLEAVLLGAVLVAAAVGFILKRVGDGLSAVAGAATQTQDLALKRSADRRAEEMHQAELRSVQLDSIKKAIEVAHLLEEVRPAVTEVAGVEIPQLDVPTMKRLEALKDQAVEAAVELTQAGSQGVELREEDPPTAR